MITKRKILVLGVPKIRVIWSEKQNLNSNNWHHGLGLAWLEVQVTHVCMNSTTEAHQAITPLWFFWVFVSMLFL